MKVSIYVACHKKFVKPFHSRFLKYMEVGRAFRKKGFLSLNDESKIGGGGLDSISFKNPSYNELTAVYWIWKNDKKSYIVGLCHYRRYFGELVNSKKTLLRPKRIKDLLNTNDILVIRRIIFNTSCRVRINEPGHCALRPQDIGIVKDIICKLYGIEYGQAFDAILDRNYEFFCNMLVCKKTLFDSYCDWLFPILTELENKINYEELEGDQKRIYGLWGEYLLNTYIEANHLKTYECENLFIEKLPYNERFKELLSEFLVKVQRKINGL